MNTGKTLFAQLMDFLPWSTFGRIVVRYHGDRSVRTLPCAGRVQRIDGVPEVHSQIIASIEPPCPSDQSLRELG